GTVPEELRRRFGNAADPEALFRIGPHPELLGRAVASLPHTDESPVAVELLRYGTEYSADRDAIVPCYVEGRVVALDGSTMDGPLRIAVGVNGTLRAITRTYLVEGWREKWAAMIPESAFRNGDNEVEFYIVEDFSSTTRLARCRRLTYRPSGN